MSDAYCLWRRRFSTQCVRHCGRSRIESRSESDAITGRVDQYLVRHLPAGERLEQYAAAMPFSDSIV
jgi:hypothetical protein